MHNLAHSRHTLSVLAAALLAVSIDASLGAQTQPLWANVSPGSGPSARVDHAMAYDSQRGVTVLFSGWDGSSTGDTWEWDGNTWTQVATTGPAGRVYHGMAYDSQRGVCVLFGGYDHSNNHLSDTWEWDGTTWTQVTTTGPAARAHHTVTYDSQRNVTVVFGGHDSNTHALGDTWEWDGTSWTQMATSGPGARQRHAMAYDSQRGVTVLFGGQDNLGELADTWEYRLPAGEAVYGSGCGNPPLDFAPSNNPVIGTTGTAILVNAPNQIAFVSLGWSNSAYNGTALPIDLTSLGLTGCLQLQSLEAVALPISAGSIPNTLQFNLAIPPSSIWLAVKLYLQAWAPAPGANPAGVITSNGIEWTLGHY